jgi:hypothetical protein
MELVNWDGAIFGPGSEWFWAMAQFVVVSGDENTMADWRDRAGQGVAGHGH